MTVTLWRETDGCELYEVRCRWGGCPGGELTEAVHPEAALDRFPRCLVCGAENLAIAAPQHAELMRLARATCGVRFLTRAKRGWVGSVPPGWAVPSRAAALLSRIGYFTLIRGRGPRRVAHFTWNPASLRRDTRPFWPALLLAAAFVSTASAGWQYAADACDRGLVTGRGQAILGLEYALAILLIVVSHEMGHWLAARRAGIRTSLPHVVPAPFLFGTMGAVIAQRSPAPDRDSLVGMAAWGPLAGVAASIAVLAVGFRSSWVIPLAALGHGDSIVFGEPLIYQGLRALLEPKAGPGMTVLAHPLLFAGWFGLFLTALNLLPAGQLDGGHILRGFLPDGLHRRITLALALLLLALGRLWPGWYLWSVILLGLAFVGDPGAMDEEPPLSPSSRVLALLCALAMAGCFMAAPVQIASGG